MKVERGELFRYEVRALAALPWPAGLGKDEIPGLRRAMRDLLKAECDNPAAHERAFATDARYRAVVDQWLSQASWSPSVVEVVSGATAFAHGVGCLGQAVEEGDWIDSARTHCDDHDIPHGARWDGGRFVAGDYLLFPITVCDEAKGIDDGRHRLTYLRLRERDGSGPSEILVKVSL
ncbi:MULTISPECIES: hypothetical protein [Mycolicibacterium]|uniref:Uncharacterized protein n=1 Tax=Mycolicibacterium alvei TaxID=67081 RepID=A0A6N4V3J3_9MYCO|nr:MULTISPECIES: hypothetical protein [Mycolicibacterium]MCV7003575.1 hypothetical protein [Mycolicibacterium alvei]OBG21587.1 hypothetical protein A5768_26145 [Mycolicibacterium fortuitum]BBX30467.1 hypothetical protein MALV_55920 [Mycolicibacterium alvei]